MSRHATFYSDLEASNAHSLLPVWEISYKRFFGDSSLKTVLAVPAGAHGDMGIDRYIHLSDGRKFSVDEKLHRDNGFKDDFLHLEYETEYPDGRIVPGWSNDGNQEPDLIAYAKEATQAVYFFWKTDLLSLWATHEIELLDSHKATSTPNLDDSGNILYITRCLLIRASDIWEYLGNTHFIQKIPEADAWRLAAAAA